MPAPPTAKRIEMWPLDRLVPYERNAVLCSVPSRGHFCGAEQPHVNHDVVIRAKRDKVADLVAPALAARHYVMNVDRVLKAADDAARSIGALSQCSPVASRLRDASNLPGPSFPSALGGAVLIGPVFELVGQGLNSCAADGAAHLNALPLWMSSPCQAPTVIVSASGGAIRAASHGFGSPSEQIAAEKAGLIHSRLPAATTVVAGNKESTFRHCLPATTLAKLHSLRAQRPNTHGS